MDVPSGQGGCMRPSGPSELSYQMETRKKSRKNSQSHKKIECSKKEKGGKEKHAIPQSGKK